MRRLPLLCVLTVWTLAGGVAPGSILAQESRPEDGDPRAGVPVSPSSQGLPGLVRVPVAASMPTGTAAWSFNTAPDFDLWGGRAEWQQNGLFTFSLFDRIVLSARGTEVRSAVPLDPVKLQAGPDFVVSLERNFLERDLSGSMQILVLEEGERTPALAVGGTDIGGSGLFEGRYAVASKTLLGRVRITAGYGLGPELLDGPFGGVEWAPSRHLTLLGEYDAHQLNAGVRLLPFPRSWIAGGMPRAAVDLLWSEGEDFSWGVSVRHLLDWDLLREAAGPGEPGGEWRQGDPGPREEEGELAGLRSTLAGAGFENVRVARGEDRTLVVEYENRRFNQSELDGTARVLAAAGRAMPAGVDTLRVVAREVDVPVLELAVAREDLDAFLGGAMAPEILRERVSVRFPGADTPGGHGPAANLSRLKLDLTVVPELRSFLFTEVGVWDWRFSLLPDAVVQLFAGTRLEARYRFPLDQTQDYYLLEGRLPDSELDRALVHHARRLPLSGERSDFWVQWSGGRFDVDHVGFRQETTLLLGGGAVALGTDVAYLGEAFGELEKTVAVASGRYYLPRWDARVSLVAGRFLDEDYGAIGEVSRFYGDTEIGLFLRYSERSHQAGIRIALPLAPARDLKPGRFRLRLPSRWEYSQKTTVFQDRNVIRTDVGRVLPSDQTLENTYLDRDRLFPAAVEGMIGRSRFWWD